jgi:alkaline phosphatase
MNSSQLMRNLFCCFVLFVLICSGNVNLMAADDIVCELQKALLADENPPAIHWGPDPAKYQSASGHTNRMIPVYTYGTAGQGEGIDITSYTGENSPYRNEAKVKRLYRGRSEVSVDPTAEYMDQTNVYDLQRAALDAGKKHIFLVVFDGMDWHTTRAAAIWNTQKVPYTEGRGTGTHFQEYQANGTSQFGFMVTSPFSDGGDANVNTQSVSNVLDGKAGGYLANMGGKAPWDSPQEPLYLIGGPKEAPVRHAVTDSSSSATSMTSGIKTYNSAVNIDPQGRQVLTIAHQAQQQGYKVGVVTSVPICHATPGAAYAHNVDRSDYQDISRDLLGLPSVSHPQQPLPGMDVVIGAGHGENKKEDSGQGKNYVPGNKYLADEDLQRAAVENKGNYVVAVRTSGENGKDLLMNAAERAAETGKRLLGYFGVGGDQSYVTGHLPFASADGDFKPAPGIDKKPIEYTAADLDENPILADMAEAALKVLSSDDGPFWLMVEAGDVDWANHSHNVDASIGAVNSGDRAVKVVTDWVEKNSNWDESVMILTGDHGHYLVVDRPECLICTEPSE